MWCKTLIGRALSMRSTPLGPWGVGGTASVGPAGAGLLGHTDACKKPYPNPDGGRAGNGVKSRISVPRATPSRPVLLCILLVRAGSH